ncbi:hypothetical protein [Rouxiella sp. WC2420]|uniref:Uncharacterized protein n=1 Tax=Rouxiella sp. WC2420 TaxID=3234145 RepID=A0AB39VZS2_9GAMM
MLENGRSHQRTRSFILWHNMLARCYTINSRGKPFFSAYKGVVVCERWHNFQYFCDDLPSLHGYTRWVNNPGEYELDKDYSYRRIYSPDTVSFISTSENAKEARLRNSAIKIQHENYRKINNARGKIFKEAESELKRNEIMYEVILHGNTKLIISDTPYGTAAFWPLTNKILRHGYITNGDVFVYLRYLNWLRLQWQSRNPHIDYIAATS